MSSITVPTSYNLPAIASAAGATEYEYRSGEFHANCSQAALEGALAAYDHAVEMAKPSKGKGFDYNGILVPVTLEDASGAMQIKLGFEEFGMTETNFEMSNGLTLHLTIEEWPAFKAQFFLFRASFFE